MALKFNVQLEARSKAELGRKMKTLCSSQDYSLAKKALTSHGQMNTITAMQTFINAATLARRLGFFYKSLH